MSVQCRESACATYVYKCEKHLVDEQLALARVEVRSHHALISAVAWAFKVTITTLTVSFTMVVYHLCVYFWGQAS